ncbi:MAG: cupin domain-containing protein [Terracidiphilus sp.]|jgi:mannose-6-phosphate isomerase-like protein (cupin superfamily)
MDPFSDAILKKLLSAEPNADTLVAKSKTSQKKPAVQSDHWSAAVLLERAAYLRKLAKSGNGAESETLKEFPRHHAMLLVRSRDGGAEVHENFADLFYVLDGRASLVTGGTVAGAASVGPGEIRGSSVEGGRRQELRAGDIAHVPAGTPHQMLVAGDKTITCLVIKIQEN